MILVNSLDSDLSSEAKDGQSLQNALQNLAKVREFEWDSSEVYARVHAYPDSHFAGWTEAAKEN